MDGFENLIITGISKVFTVNGNKGRYVKIKNRDSYGLTFCKNGKITYTHKDKKYISTPDYALILPQGEDYELYNNESGSFPVINFKCTGWESREFLRIPLKSSESYISDYEKMHKLSLLKNNNLKIMHLLYGMFERLSEENLYGAGILAPAVNYIESNCFDSSVDIKMLAGLSGICESYFRRLFVQKYNISPKSYIINLRLTYARQLLSESKLEVSKISEKCGFSSVYHFCRTFKSQFGETPTEYRNRTFRIQI